MKFFRNLLLVLMFLGGSATIALAEEISNFSANITPYADGTFLVEETIVYNFKDAQKHGIFRYLPTQHAQPATSWYKNRFVEYEIKSVTLDEEEVNFTVTEEANQLFLKIGDAAITVTGLQTYKISYLVSGGLHYYDDGTTEIYWDITGADWPVVILNASATIDNEGGLLNSERFCYTGVPGETQSCTSIIATGTKIAFVSPILFPGSNFTIAQELNKKVAVLIEEETPPWFLWGAVVIFWFSLVAYFVYRYKTKYNPHKTVVSQYEPFEDFKPMFTGVLNDGSLDARDITAGLVYLAEGGFIKIKHTEKKVMLFFEVDDYEVTLLKSIAQVETQFLRDVLTLLFEETEAVGKTVSLSNLKADTSKRKANALKVQKLRDAVVEDLVTRGYFERVLSLPLVLLIIVLMVVILPFTFPLLVMVVGSFALPLLIIVIGTAVILGFGYQRRTTKGYLALNHLKGFKEFLSVTDAERFKFHNAPQKSPEQFMQFLPYAIALGVEKEWGEVFKDIQIAQPDWYDGNGTFAATALASDLGNFSSSFTATSTNPSSSGSGGGGFSGGGSGGGGGGSW
jgi:uncharacterized membrane protein